MLKSTDRQFQFQRDVVFTNDQNSVRVNFAIKDMTDTELSGATADVLLYMRDGSFYQVSSPSVTKDGATFRYTLKGNEGKHRGVVKAQLVVKLSSSRHLASRKCEFEIDTGLDNIVATEVMISDWTTLTKEAREFIDEIKANEVIRIDSEETRKSSESERISQEEDRASAEVTRGQQEQSRVDAEALRTERFQDMQLTQNLDDGKAYKTTLEIFSGMPRLKLEEVSNG